MDRVVQRLKRIWHAAFSAQQDARGTRRIPPINAEEVAEIKTFFPLEKFFIFGHARSGTTLLVRLVRLHPQVHCNYQAHFFSLPPLLSGMAEDQRIGEWLSQPSNRWNRGRDLTPVALRAMADLILEREARQVGKTIVGDKSPNVLTNGRAVREMFVLYPDARLIYIVRDGRDALLSHRFQNFIDSAQSLPKEDIRLRDAFAEDPELFLRGERSIFTDRALRRMAQGWVQNVTETDQLGRELYGDRYLSLHYEALISQPYDTISNVWRFLGADPTGLESAVAQEMNRNPDAEWQKQAAADLAANLEKGKRGSWRNLFTEQDKRIFKTIAGNTLITWGYEKDNEW